MANLSLPVTVQYIDEKGVHHVVPGARSSAYGLLDILDQTRLPERLERLQIFTPEGVYDAIKRLCVRGAPAIGCSAAIGLAVCAARFKENTASAFFDKFCKKISCKNIVIKAHDLG